MKIKSKISKKISALLLAMTLTLGLGIVAYAATFGDDLNGASTLILITASLPQETLT